MLQGSAVRQIQNDKMRMDFRQPQKEEKSERRPSRHRLEIQSNEKGRNQRGAE
jgi:hypothetical protein